MIDHAPSDKSSDNNTSFQYMLLRDGAKCPAQATPNSAGFDVYSPVSCSISPQQTAKIPLYIAIQPPEGMYIRMTSRSGLALHHKVFTCADVIDPDYTGELHICLFNASDCHYHINQNDRIGSIVFEKYGLPIARQVHTLRSTCRGASGFGSSGV